MRIYALVEGRTESRFVERVLGPHLGERGVSIWPIQVRTGPLQRGGATTFQHVERDIRNLKQQHTGQDVRFTTMFDYYRLPNDFPGKARGGNTAVDRVRQIELEMGAALAEPRLIPYIQLHEFEALLFADLMVAQGVFPFSEDRDAMAALQRETAEFANPELINDGEATSPSNRLIAKFRRYQRFKADAGPAAAVAIGLPKLRATCPHFDEWIRLLESVAGA